MSIKWKAKPDNMFRRKLNFRQKEAILPSLGLERAQQPDERTELVRQHSVVKQTNANKLRKDISSPDGSGIEIEDYQTPRGRNYQELTDDEDEIVD